MIVDSMTHTEVYKELDKDIAEVTAWWIGMRVTLEKIAKWTTKLPFERWYEYTSTRHNRYLVYCVIMGRNYNNDSMTAPMALRKMDRGWTVYTYHFPWQHRAGKHVILPHVFDRYHDPGRGNVPKTGINLIKHLFEHNNHGEVLRGDKFSGRSVRYKGRDNLCKCINDGIMLGEMIGDIFVAHSFITYEMAGGLQREEFERNRENIVSNEELLAQHKIEDKQEMQVMREQILQEIAMEKKYGKTNLIQVKQ